MAEEYLVKKESLTAIADAIRAKTGGADALTLAQMPTEIEGIETGITPEGTLEITENGTYDVTQYAEANVNIPVGESIPDGTNITFGTDEQREESYSILTITLNSLCYVVQQLCDIDTPLTTAEAVEKLRELLSYEVTTDGDGNVTVTGLDIEYADSNLTILNAVGSYSDGNITVEV